MSDVNETVLNRIVEVGKGEAIPGTSKPKKAKRKAAKAVKVKTAAKQHTVKAVKATIKRRKPQVSALPIGFNIVIEDNVPKPDKKPRGATLKYPLTSLKVNDQSFWVPKQTAKSLHTAIYYQKAKNPGMKWEVFDTTKDGQEGVRVFRVA